MGISDVYGTEEEKVVYLIIIIPQGQSQSTMIESLLARTAVFLAW